MDSCKGRETIVIFVTGDKHGRYDDIEYFCQNHNTNKDDMMIILGDNGVNFYGGRRDKAIKEYLSNMPITFMMIRGNHDMRPPIDVYQEKRICTEQYSGTFLVDPQFQSLLFAIDGNNYELNKQASIVIGGAYSVDKYFRLENGYRWFDDEQLSFDEMINIERYLDFVIHPTYETSYMKLPQIILSHTCPFQYIPYDMFISQVDQSTVDDTMEHWLDKINAIVKPKAWYCGHWHTDRLIDNVRFMYKDIIDFK